MSVCAYQKGVTGDRIVSVLICFYESSCRMISFPVSLMHMSWQIVSHMSVVGSHFFVARICLHWSGSCRFVFRTCVFVSCRVFLYYTG